MRNNTKSTNETAKCRTKIFGVLISILVATLTLLVIILIITGADGFFDLFVDSSLIIAAISALAGIITLSLKRKGLLFSVICGILTALAGFIVVFYKAMAGI